MSESYYFETPKLIDQLFQIYVAIMDPLIPINIIESTTSFNIAGFQVSLKLLDLPYRYNFSMSSYGL